MSSIFWGKKRGCARGEKPRPSSGCWRSFSDTTGEEGDGDWTWTHMDDISAGENICFICEDASSPTASTVGTTSPLYLRARSAACALWNGPPTHVVAKSNKNATEPQSEHCMKSLGRAQISDNVVVMWFFSSPVHDVSYRKINVKQDGILEYCGLESNLTKVKDSVYLSEDQHAYEAPWINGDVRSMFLCTYVNYRKFWNLWFQCYIYWAEV